jgi:hypothetical protein
MQPDPVFRECQQAHGKAMSWLVQILPAKIETFIERRTWEGVNNGVSGEPFQSFYECATTRIPHGLGFDGECKRLTYQEVVRYCELQRSDVAAMMRNEVPELAGHGGIRGQVDNVNLPKGGNDPTYLVRRMKRDAPEIAQALAGGEFRSVRAAAIAAGIVKVPTPFEQVMKLWPKLSVAERKQVADGKPTKASPD